MYRQKCRNKKSNLDIDTYDLDYNIMSVHRSIHLKHVYFKIKVLISQAICEFCAKEIGRFWSQTNRRANF